MLGELATTQALRISEYRLRKNRFAQHTFRKDESEFAKTNGWELVKENQNTDRYQKLKSHDEQLENEFWCLMYNFGYPNLNIGRNFQIQLTSTISKQIDIFAYDDETIIIAECKSAEKRSKKSFQKDLGEFVANQKQISNTLRKFFGGKFEQKIIWLFVTKNIEWSTPDLDRAAEANVKVVTERELFYYKEIAKRVGHSARFQFHAEFLEKTKVSALEHTVFALRTKLGSLRAYAFFAPAPTVLPITFVNHRDLRDPEAAPSYQRLIHRPKLKDISAYLKAGGFFPNSVILNFKKKVRFDILKPEDEGGIAAGQLTLPNTYKSAWIIDGQHRLYGYTELDEEVKSTVLPFLAFEMIDIAEETKIFADINSKQRSVSKKLLDEITGEIKLDSPNRKEQLRAIASRCFDLLRDDEDGPFGDKISGTEIKKSDESVLTVPYLVDATLQSAILGKIVTSGGTDNFMQGPLFWEDPRKAISSLAVLLTEYFSLYRNANTERWEAGKLGKFASNVGVAASIRLVADLITFMEKKDGLDPREMDPKSIIENIEPYAEPVFKYFKEASNEDLEKRLNVPFGSGGPRVFQHRLRELIHEKHKDFDPTGFADDFRKFDSARRDAADKMVREIQDQVHRFVVAKLKSLYGEAGEDYLSLAVDNKEILKSAFAKRVDDTNPKDLATYLDFIELKKVVEAKKHWAEFAGTFSIQLPTEKKGQARYLGWFDEINRLRRVSAHPYNRGYDDQEFEKLNYVYAHLCAASVIPKS